eukprot:COSAG06_NODE_10456_length_1679_cov_1.265823_2_plen_78_part_00
MSVRKTAFFEPFINAKNALFDQDRTGPNIGTVLKKGPFSAGFGGMLANVTAHFDNIMAQCAAYDDEMVAQVRKKKRL